ncbi:FAD/NAD(P)-binding domain-containing protein [Mollisia scopiformis]|uniref:FAD/NAD(P)-binding domain-containing protein n=1 Tax=Mollisia scopiformis TaxID=149040 RepID=A0A194WY79_MOLSC|nr:FAD/NAD(P)-binding domain-containing protein [Mollisia scopiformis]KUJ12639.1 FAD/NAD(P)-binding domain-containing protein [Mollisia scopiformis]
MENPSPIESPFKIAIIGGGLAGILLAIGLSSRDISVQIYEAAPTFAETSAGIGFGPNAVRAMTLLDPRIRAAYESLKTENSWESKRNIWFDFRRGWGQIPELLTELKMGHESEGGGNVLRARFMEELVKLLPVKTAEFGKNLSRVDDEGDSVRLWFQDGTQRTTDAVVGCDGIRSVVRKFLLGQDNPASQAVFSGVYAYRGLIQMDTAIDAVGEELALNSQVYVGNDGDLVTYPIEGGSLLNVVAFRKHDVDTWNHPKWIVDYPQGKLMKDFEGWGSIPLSLLKLLDKPQAWALFEMPSISSYSMGRITLLGDAAHGSTSHAGAGAGMAVEDALVLTNMLADPRVHLFSDIAQVFAVYSMVRHPRTQRLVRHSRESGMLFQLRKPGVEDDLRKLKEDLQNRQLWIWDINLKNHLERAKIELSKVLNEKRKV